MSNQAKARKIGRRVCIRVFRRSMVDGGMVAKGHGYIASGSSIPKARCDADCEKCRVVEVWVTRRIVLYETDGSSAKALWSVFEDRIWSIGSAREDSGKSSNVRKTEDSSGLNCRFMNCRNAIRGKYIRIGEDVLQT